MALQLLLFKNRKTVSYHRFIGSSDRLFFDERKLKLTLTFCLKWDCHKKFVHINKFLAKTLIANVMAFWLKNKISHSLLQLY